MTDYPNPFEYEAATKLSPEEILEFYIEDFNYSRFIRSRRNIMLLGERGSGKTMTLLFNSFPVQLKKTQKDNDMPSYKVICVYVPCNTPLTHKQEYKLLEEFQASVLSEHFLVLSIIYEIAKTLSKAPDLFEDAELKLLKRELYYTIGIKVLKDVDLCASVMQWVQREISITQKQVNDRHSDTFYNRALSFSAGVLPMLMCLRKIPRLSSTHFALMLDDAHDLNAYQIKTLNSWIAYRDNSIFSFKVAMAKVDRPTHVTTSGGTILEGHDYTLVDMEQPYQNQFSDFGKFARNIFGRRLDKIGIKKSPDEFLPENTEFKTEMEQCSKKAEEEAKKKYPGGSKKQIQDYIYKYARAIYFRERASTANRPRQAYSGFDTLVHLSTGVVRNLLDPCFWMYDKVISGKRSSGEASHTVESIPPAIQAEVILNRSKLKWDWIREGLDNSIDGCSREQAKQIYQLLDNLAVLFKERLLSHKSEPRAISFTISGHAFEKFTELEKLLNIARKAQLLYVRSSSAKDWGKRELYYIPNRILWPERGLDPNGQHARVSIPAEHLWAAAVNNEKLSLISECLDENVIQERLNV